jgi:hypothetical protein
MEPLVRLTYESPNNHDKGCGKCKLFGREKSSNVSEVDLLQLALQSRLGVGLRAFA